MELICREKIYNSNTKDRRKKVEVYCEFLPYKYFLKVNCEALKKHTINPRKNIKKKKKGLKQGLANLSPQAIWLIACYPLIYVLPMIAFALQQQNCIVITKTIWPSKPEIHFFTEKVYQPLA